MADLKPPHGILLPATATALAAAYLAAVWLPPQALLPVVVAVPLATCALVLHYRPSRAARLVLALVAAWLLIGLGGVWLLRARPVAGLLVALLGLFVVPLPLVPSLYAATFRDTLPPPEDHGP